jgi:hypothetical protein
MKALKNESDEGRMVHIMEAIKSFKVFGAGGASTSNSTQGWFAGKFRFSLHSILVIFYPF